MDEDISFFLKRYGPPISPIVVPASSLTRYKNKLPEQLLKYWEEFGWCGYAEGLLWVVNPQDYESIIQQWLANSNFDRTDSYHVIARSAFGELYVWGERSGYCLTITSYLARFCKRVSRFAPDNLDFGVRVFFSSLNPEDDDEDGLFTLALRKLGPLKHDEMYGFVPAIALGGALEVEHIDKVNAVAHLTFLSELSPLKDWDFIEQ